MENSSPCMKLDCKVWERWLNFKMLKSQWKVERYTKNEENVVHLKKRIYPIFILFFLRNKFYLLKLTIKKQRPMSYQRIQNNHDKEAQWIKREHRLIIQQNQENSA